MQDCDFCDYKDFEYQILHASEHFYIIYPRKPIFAFHMMIVAKTHRREFVELNDEEVVDQRDVIKKLKRDFDSHEGALLGYNLFSNNGEESIGQSVPHYHCHIFLRFEDEVISPYKILNNPDLKTKLSPDEWMAQRDGIAAQLS